MLAVAAPSVDMSTISSVANLTREEAIVGILSPAKTSVSC